MNATGTEIEESEEGLLERKPYRKRRVKKHWKIECCWKTPRPGMLYKFWTMWTRHGTYETEPQARQAVRDIADRPFWRDMQFRLVNTKTKAIFQVS
jgi:hypothetical protein